MIDGIIESRDIEEELTSFLGGKLFDTKHKERFIVVVLDFLGAEKV